MELTSSCFSLRNVYSLSPSFGYSFPRFLHKFCLAYAMIPVTIIVKGIDKNASSSTHISFQLLLIEPVIISYWNLDLCGSRLQQAIQQETLKICKHIICNMLDEWDSSSSFVRCFKKSWILCILGLQKIWYDYGDSGNFFICISFFQK